MPQVVRVQVILNPQEQTRDQVMNTWHIQTVGTASTAVAAEEFAGDLDVFYHAIDAGLSGEMNGKLPLVRGFDLSEPKPRQPVYEDFFSSALSNSSTQAVRELSVCLSYKAPYVSGVSPKRKRGRIYLGPLGTGVLSTTDGTFATTTRSDWITAAGALLTASNGSSTYRWVVYSPTTDTAGTGMTGFDPVIGGWIDTNVDIQRRRGLGTSSRTIF